MSEILNGRIMSTVQGWDAWIPRMLGGIYNVV
jgi:hypothetical protein